jgi:uncharacterized sodium:solute symporter family permease YidK
MRLFISTPGKDFSNNRQQGDARPALDFFPALVTVAFFVFMLGYFGANLFGSRVSEFGQHLGGLFFVNQRRHSFDSQIYNFHLFPSHIGGLGFVSNTFSRGR